MKNKVAVLLPCYNEEKAIGKVIQDFKKELPQADIYVYDNNSTDNSVQIARQNQAIVRHVPLQGKANVVRAMFHEVDADVFVMADTDGSHLASDAHAMIEALHERQADMVVGDRMSQGSYHTVNKRRYHNAGNQFICRLINYLFRTKVNDVTSGYRVFNRYFAKNMPVMSSGFEVEAEMTLHALDKRFSMVEVPVDYKARQPDSASKLNTLSDGIRIIKIIVKLFKDYKPLAFFSLLALLSVAAQSGFWHSRHHRVFCHRPSA